jgi:hypothetical protein
MHTSSNQSHRTFFLLLINRRLERGAGAGVPAAGHVAGPGCGLRGAVGSMLFVSTLGPAAPPDDPAAYARLLTGRARRAPARPRRRLPVARGHRRVHGRVRRRRVRAAAQGVPRRPAIRARIGAPEHRAGPTLAVAPGRSASLPFSICCFVAVDVHVSNFVWFPFLLITVAMGTRCSWMLPPLRPADHSLLRKYCYHYYNVPHFFRDYK